MSSYVLEGLLAKRKRSTSKKNVKERVQKVLGKLVTRKTNSPRECYGPIQSGDKKPFCAAMVRLIFGV